MEAGQQALEESRDIAESMRTRRKVFSIALASTLWWSRSSLAVWLTTAQVHKQVAK